MVGGGRSPRVLILGGTAEAAALADVLADRGVWQAVTSLAGATRSPAPVSGEVRRGGFGGSEGLAAFLTETAIDAMVDATHPFAAQISTHAVAAAATAGTPLVRLQRPEWRPADGDDWIDAADAAAAAAVLPRAARVFLATGRRELPAFASTDAFVLVRLIDPPDRPLPLANHTLTLGRGPFALDGELALLRRHRIGWLVSKNSGGSGAFPKIQAARALGVRVVMIRRPALPAADTVSDVAGATAFLQAVLTPPDGDRGRRAAGL